MEVLTLRGGGLCWGGSRWERSVAGPGKVGGHNKSALTPFFSCFRRRQPFSNMASATSPEGGDRREEQATALRRLAQLLSSPEGLQAAAQLVQGKCGLPSTVLHVLLTLHASLFHQLGSVWMLGMHAITCVYLGASAQVYHRTKAKRVPKAPSSLLELVERHSPSALGNSDVALQHAKPLPTKSCSLFVPRFGGLLLVPKR